jgi:glutamyl-tRNA reductase
MEDWAKRVQMYEHGFALQQLALGKNQQEVLDQMASRIIQKMLHPVLKGFQDRSIDMEQFEKNKQAYYEKMQRVGPSADHVVDDRLPGETDQLGYL